MDVLFENRYTRDKQWAKDFYGYIFFRRPIMMFFNIMCAISLAVNIFLVIVSDPLEDLSVLFILIFYFLILFVRYFKGVNLEMKRSAEMYGGPVLVELFVKDEKISTKTSTGSEVDMLFQNVKKAINTKNYIYLQTQTKLLLCLKKDSFTVGSCEDFIEFLRNKGFKVK